MEEVLHLINEMAPYLLLGFFLAGLMHAFIPGRYYSRYLAHNSLGSVVNAALFGIPLPLCSCGVIPTAMSLRKEGASKGATVSFLVSTPQTGIDSIIATYSLMGLPFALVRPLAALVTSVFGGVLTNAMTPSEEKQTANGEPASECLCDERHFADRLLEAFRYAYVEMMQDIGKWLVIGLIVAGLITVFVPDELFGYFEGNTVASMLLVLCIALPMYLCATGSIPIAVALMLKGLTPGAALVLLMAGPACNFASILVVRKVLGSRTLFVYLVSIIIGAVGFGCLIDYLQFSGAVDFLQQLTYRKTCCAHNDSWFSWCCTVLLAILLFNALVLKRVCHKSTKNNINNSVMNTRVYHIEGMNCNHCRMAAEKALSSVPGVESVHVDLDSKEARVTGTADEALLSKAVSEVGFRLVE